MSDINAAMAGLTMGCQLELEQLRAHVASVIERLEADVKGFDEMAGRAAGIQDWNNYDRALGSVEGIRLALSYLREEQ